MSQVFDNIYLRIAQKEGGYVNHPNDRGGETYRGITRRWWPKWRGWSFIDRKKPIKSKTILPELEPLVKEFYYENYFKKALIDKVENSALAFQLFDLRMNSTGGSAWIVRKSLSDLTVGGNLQGSPVTNLPWNESLIDNVNRFPFPEQLFEQIKKNREYYVKILAEKNPDQQVFLKGWINRIRSEVYGAWVSLSNTEKKK